MPFTRSCKIKSPPQLADIRLTIRCRVIDCYDAVHKTRRLAVANRSRVSIVVDPVKICLTASLITVRNLVVVSHSLLRARVPKILGTLGPPHLRMIGVADPRETFFFATCVTVPSLVMVKPYERNYGDPPEKKILTLRDPPFKVTQGH